jgi:hypothetical protein
MDRPSGKFVSYPSIQSILTFHSYMPWKAASYVPACAREAYEMQYCIVLHGELLGCERTSGTMDVSSLRTAFASTSHDFDHMTLITTSSFPSPILAAS